MTEHDQQSAFLGKIVAYTELLVNDPRSTIFVSLAETYRKIGLFNDARDIVVKGLEQHPDFGPAYVVLARIECQLENYAASCDGFERALTLDPDSLAALVGYARVKLLLHHDDEAQDLLIHARSLSPADPVINKMLLGLSSASAAEEEMAPVIESVRPAPNNLTSLASTTLADLYLAQGMTDKALTLYHQLLSRNPDNLALRRKIREVEGRTDEPFSEQDIVADALPSSTSDDQIAVEDHKVTEPLAGATAEQDESVSDPAEPVDEVTHDVTDASAIPVAPSEADVEIDEESHETVYKETAIEESVAADDQTEIIHQLNTWLDNIRLRREHV